MRKILEKCPSCGGKLEVTRLNCQNCETIILSRYEPCPFCRLSPENTKLLLAFVKCRGNVKEMERELGQSYWTIRKLVDGLVEAMGFDATAPGAAESDTTAHELDILSQVDQGQISAAQAAKLLAELKK